VAWHNPDSETITGYTLGVFSNTLGNVNGWFTRFSGGSSGDPIESGTFQASSAAVANAGVNYDSSTWYFAAGIFGGASSRYQYVDGTIGSEETTSLTPTTVDIVVIGCRYNDANNTFQTFSPGLFDSPSIHSAARSEAWLDTEYNQSNTTALFAAPGTPEDVGGGGTDALTATDIATGAPTVGTPTIGQTHALTATDVATGAVSVGTPTIAQVHALTAQDVTTGAVVADAPTLGQAHALAAVDVLIGTPTIDEATLAQVHAMVAVDVTTGAVVVGTPVLSEPGAIVALTAQDVLIGAPVVGTPTLGEAYINVIYLTGDIVRSIALAGDVTRTVRVHADVTRTMEIGAEI
jgi:hypothetical protein